jgi:hypothetical protein
MLRRKTISAFQVSGFFNHHATWLLVAIDLAHLDYRTSIQFSGDATRWFIS